MSTGSNPFTISELGEPGSLVAVADFTCPKCGQHSRFFAHHQAEDGSFTCGHCGLNIQISGMRLSDYQEQLDAINSSLGDFTAKVTDRVKRASQRLGETVDAPGASDDESPEDPSTDHRHGPDCGRGHVH